ncbi:MAG: 30S ribosomal protein S20 [Clostridia bacterium]|nr:30S ribosomal protein S20 [Clostridia bacterium]MBR4955552.1 30S ribosomal protein S20 [Clostridia bacterium]MBR5903030.1 30S ribosomal protein S20 [Clostridia bacterium]
MPNIKSAKKRVLVSRQENAANRAAKTALKTQLKKFDAAVAAGEGDLEVVYRETVAGVDKAAGAGVIHKNAAARKKSQITKKLAAAK